MEKRIIAVVGATGVQGGGLCRAILADNAVEPDVYRSWGFPGADEMGNMFQFFRDFEQPVLAARSVDETRKLNPALETFENFVRRNKDRILAATAPTAASV